MAGFSEPKEHFADESVFVYRFLVLPLRDFRPHLHPNSVNERRYQPECHTSFTFSRTLK